MQAYKPHLKQQSAHRAFLVDGFKRGVLFWGRQVGKSLWSVKHLQTAACIKQGQYFIVFKTHKHAKDVMWRQYLYTIPKELIYDTNSTELTITFNYIKGPVFIPGLGWQAICHDINKPRSSIQLLGSDYADDHRGRFADGMIFDEYQDQDPANWEAVYKYFFTTTKGWAAFMGTARGYNHWYDLIEYARQEGHERWYYSEATWRDNPVVDPEWIMAERKEAEQKGELDTFLQEVELQFRTLQGAVYPTFDRKIHVITPSGMRAGGSSVTVPDPTDGSLYGVWDFGWTEGHPTAFNFVQIDGQGRRFVTDEIHGTELEMDDVISQIRMKLGERRLTGIIGDSARPDLIAYARSKGLPMIDAIKGQGSVQSGITLLKQKIKPKIQLIGLPEPEYYFFSNCKQTIYQFENYKYKENRADRPASEVPVKLHDDHPDAIRYLELFLKYSGTQKREPIRTSIKFNDYGLMA